MQGLGSIQGRSGRIWMKQVLVAMGMGDEAALGEAVLEQWLWPLSLHGPGTLTSLKMTENAIFPG